MYPNFFRLSIPIVKSFGVRNADKGCPSVGRVSRPVRVRTVPHGAVLLVSPVPWVRG